MTIQSQANRQAHLLPASELAAATPELAGWPMATNAHLRAWTDGSLAYGQLDQDILLECYWLERLKEAERAEKAERSAELAEVERREAARYAAAGFDAADAACPGATLRGNPCPRRRTLKDGRLKSFCRVCHKRNKKSLKALPLDNVDIRPGWQPSRYLE